LTFAPIWRQWTSSAPPGSWRAWVHCQDYEGCKRNKVEEQLDGMVQVATVPSKRCTDLVTPQWQLMQFAVAQSKSYRDPNDKFVLLSSACLPLKPFSYVYGDLCSNALTDLCLFKTKEWQLTRIAGHKAYLVKHGQWAILNRENAESFARHWTRLDDQGRWMLRMPMEKFNGIRFYVDRKDKHNWRCADEFALFATLYGFLVPGKYGPDRCPLDKNTVCQDLVEFQKQSRCRTMFFFYKEERRRSEELALMLEDKGNKISWKGDGHPAEFKYLTPESMWTLRQSPFLFARKFNNNFTSEKFASILFSEALP